MDVPQAVAIAITNVCHEVERNKQNTSHVYSGEFTGRSGTRPSIPIGDFIDRLMKYTTATDQDLIMVLALIDQLLVMTNGRIHLSFQTAHRIFAIALIIAIKFNDDVYYKNTYYSKVIGIDTKEFNNLERAFLSYIDYNVWISQEKLSFYVEYINRIIDINPQPS